MPWFVEVFIPEDVRKFVLVCQNSLEVHSSIMQTPQLKRNKKPSQTRWRSADIALRKKKNWLMLRSIPRAGETLRLLFPILWRVSSDACFFLRIHDFVSKISLFAGRVFFWFPFQRIGWCVCQMCANCSLSAATLRQHDVKCNRHFMA